MSRLLALLPSWAPLAQIGVLLVALGSGAWALYRSIEAKGAAEALAANLQTVIAQQKRDAVLSADLVQAQAIELTSLRNRSATIITRIERVPVTTGCGDVMRDASRGVRELLAPGGGGPPAGPQPPATVR